MTDLNYLIYDNCLNKNLIKNMTMVCVGQLVPDCTMLSFSIRPGLRRFGNKLTEKELLLDCCKFYKAIVKAIPEYKGWYGHIVLNDDRVHYVEDFKEMEKELKNESTN